MAQQLPVRDPVTDYEKIKRIGEGTYGVVYKARHRSSGKYVALKKILLKEGREGLPVTAVRELRVLQTCQHPNIVKLKKVVTGTKADSIFMVFEFCEHDCGRLIDSMKHPFKEAEVKCLMKQLLSAVAWLHRRWTMHRDLKLSNLLMTRDGVVKLCDFGLARYSQAYTDALTPNVVTLWYRAPELIMGEDKYDDKIDMWAVGCIMGELLQHSPLFPGKSEVAMLKMFADLLGNPEQVWKEFRKLPHADKIKLASQPYSFLDKKFSHVSRAGVNLLSQLLTYDPEKRISARRALEHLWFQQRPLPVEPQDMPRFPSTQDAEQQTVSKRAQVDQHNTKEQKEHADQRFGQIFGAGLDGHTKRRRLD